jgi:hypothetical protein
MGGMTTVESSQMCSSCGTHPEASWRWCPDCGGTLVGSSRRESAGDSEADVRMMGRFGPDARAAGGSSAGPGEGAGRR